MFDFDERFVCELKALINSMPTENYNNGVLVLGGTERLGILTRRLHEYSKFKFESIFTSPLFPCL